MDRISVRFASLLLAKHVGRAHFLGNLGLAILGSPVAPNSQADLLTYGVAILVPVRRKIHLVGEIHGRQGPERLGNESQSQVRLGAQVQAGGLRCFFTAGCQATAASCPPRTRTG